MVPPEEPQVEVCGRVLSVRLWEAELSVHAVAWVLRIQAIGGALLFVALTEWMLEVRLFGGEFPDEGGLALFADLTITLMLWNAGSGLANRNRADRASGIAALMLWVAFVAYLRYAGPLRGHTELPNLADGFLALALPSLRWLPSLIALLVLAREQASRVLLPGYGSHRLAPLVSAPNMPSSAIGWASLGITILSALSLPLYLPCCDTW